MSDWNVTRVIAGLNTVQQMRSEICRVLLLLGRFVKRGARGTDEKVFIRIPFHEMGDRDNYNLFLGYERSYEFAELSLKFGIEGGRGCDINRPYSEAVTELPIDAVVKCHAKLSQLIQEMAKVWPGIIEELQLLQVAADYWDESRPGGKQTVK